jgi:hypothetical protein
MAMVIAAAIFLRWMPHHGWFVGTLVAAAGVTALAINVTRKRRVRRAVRGIYQESMPPDLTSTAAVAASVVILGIYTVLVLPFDSSHDLLPTTSMGLLRPPDDVRSGLRGH